MEFTHRCLARTLVLAALVLAAGLVAVPAVAQPTYVDGFVTLSPDGNCMFVKEHDGRVLTVVGRWYGLTAHDYVRFEGRLVPDRFCGGPAGVEIVGIQSIWSDEAHRTFYYSHDRDGEYQHWLEMKRHREWERDRERERRLHYEPAPPPPQ
jgi:hypothetical protein